MAATSAGALAASKTFPDYPAECKVKISPKIRDGDDVRVIAKKLDAALHRQWDRVDYCGDWYDELQAGVAG